MRNEQIGQVYLCYSPGDIPGKYDIGNGGNLWKEKGVIEYMDLLLGQLLLKDQLYNN